MWWDDVVTLDGGGIVHETMSYCFGSDPVDSYAEFFEIEGSAEEVFAEVKAAIEANGWVYEEGDSADPVTDPQWFVSPEDADIYVGVLMSSPEELEENKMVAPDGYFNSGQVLGAIFVTCIGAST
jgi:hypothetical protein